MSRLILILVCLLCASVALASGTPVKSGADSRPAGDLKDVYFGEALYHAYQGEWFESVARLDTELGQHRRVDEPALDTLYPHLNQAEFDVGDFELGYRMHLRAGRAIRAVIEGKVDEPQRNAAIYRLARLYFRKDQPREALQALERIRGEVPERIRDDVEFLRAQVLMANGRFEDASRVLKGLQGAKGLEGFTGYNLGISLMEQGKEQDGRQYLDRAGQLASLDPSSQAIRDKSNLVLGYKLLDENNGAGAKLVLDRVRLTGPFSNRALLGSGWADANQGEFERALVPWSILARREVTDPAVQEALLAMPFAYGKLKVYGKAALLYGQALESFGKEIDKLGASITSVREGKFLKALAREELKQDSDWVVKLRSLPEAPETYYLLDLMASHDFQESLKNYLDLNELSGKLVAWEGDLNAFEEMIRKRRDYYEPLLPGIDQAFKQLDSQIRLREEQRDRIEKRLHAMLTAPRPDHLATAQERIALEEISRLERSGGGALPDDVKQRLARLRGVISWNIATQYHQRFTDTFEDLDRLNRETELLKRQYDSFVRTRQAATQSYQGYDGAIAQQRQQIASAREKVAALLPRQGKILEAMAVEEMTKRRARLEQFQVTARFAIADSYDRANKAQAQKRVGP
ncbi:hypothetical protein KP003_17350 [Geomonas nitrogeniifigens]|uniref:Tetratricopeptide repeat protein n=1 Tax=Geomonas diazotrophica TaxID=2843197 RepID=A0ABX8JHF2_9BACT|nr:hypothetical protein [Geomonas nitrogeniifigens]QWV96932.1 hypothetical protein KP005_16500 [Geomonas nitrogeniifigens]QXE86108.1 hypothetical protein KP003_17350 [Geomonas nitrogeniifigens]